MCMIVLNGTKIYKELIKMVENNNRNDRTDEMCLDDKQVITTCPECGCSITEANDAGNGLCIDCTRNEKIIDT